MYEDEHLESDYEDRYTIQGDIDTEDDDYYESDEDDEDLDPDDYDELSEAGTSQSYRDWIGSAGL